MEGMLATKLQLTVQNNYNQNLQQLSSDTLIAGKKT